MVLLFDAVLAFFYFTALEVALGLIADVVFLVAGVWLMDGILMLIGSVAVLSEPLSESSKRGRDYDSSMSSSMFPARSLIEP